MGESASAAGYLSLAPDITSVVPTFLQEQKRWTAWVTLPPKKDGAKPAKKPLSLSNAPATWRTFSEALAEAEGRAGVGFQLLGCSTLIGIDLDGCVDPTTGAVAAFAQQFLDKFPDTYAEITPSGRGLRLFALAGGVTVPEYLSREHGVEVYVGKSARFLTVTGRVLAGRAGKLADITPQGVKLIMSFATATASAGELEVKLPVPGTERHPEWKQFFDKRLPYSKVAEGWRSFLESGDLPGARSEKQFGIACKLLEARYTADEIFAILVSAPGSWEAALDKRDQDTTRARSLIWSDIGRAQKIVRADETGLQERAEGWAGLGLRTVVKGKNIIVERSSINAARILTDHEEWRGRLALDITTGLVLLDNTPLDDYRLFQMQERIGAFANWEPSAHRQWWTDLVRAVAERNPINPRAAELRAVKWDGTERLDTWFNQCVVQTPSKLDATLGRKWLISVVARWLEPGCKCDTVLILQGREGARKNTLFEVLAGSPDRVVSINGFETDDMFVAAQAWIAQIPESHLFRRADRNRLKGWITEPIDQFRPPYAAKPVKVRRAYPLVSTANEGDLFNWDQDGLRRFWPVKVRDRINYEWVRDNRDQLLAEAVLAYDLEEEWWFEESPHDLKVRVKESMEESALDEAVRTLIDKQRGKGGLMFNAIMVELGATLGFRPRDTDVTKLLYKHDFLKKRSSAFRYWMHPSWAVKGEGNVIPLRPEEDDEDAKLLN